MLWRWVGYYSVTGWLETNLDCGDCDHSCTVIRTQSHDLWSYTETENGRLPSGPPSEEIAIGRSYKNCKWKWMWARQFCVHSQKNLDVRVRHLNQVLRLFLVRNQNTFIVIGLSKRVNGQTMLHLLFHFGRNGIRKAMLCIKKSYCYSDKVTEKKKHFKKRWCISL